MVRGAGLEPARRKTLDPKSSASANFATRAYLRRDQQLTGQRHRKYNRFTFFQSFVSSVTVKIATFVFGLSIGTKLERLRPTIQMIVSSGKQSRGILFLASEEIFASLKTLFNFYRLICSERNKPVSIFPRPKVKCVWQERIIKNKRYPCSSNSHWGRVCLPF